MVVKLVSNLLLCDKRTFEYNNAIRTQYRHFAVFSMLIIVLIDVGSVDTVIHSKQRLM